MVRSLACIITSVEIAGRVTVIAEYVVGNGLAYVSAALNVTLCIAKGRVYVIRSTDELALGIVTLDIAIVRIGVNDLSYVTAAFGVTGRITTVLVRIKYVRNGSFVSATFNVTYGIANGAVLMSGLASKGTTLYVTCGIAVVIELVSGLAGESAAFGVTGGIAVVIELVGDLTDESAARDATGSVAIVAIFVLDRSLVSAFGIITNGITRMVE